MFVHVSKNRTMFCCVVLLLCVLTEVPKTGLNTPFRGGTVRDIALQVCVSEVDKGGYRK